MSNQACIFCRIVAGEILAELLHEDEQCIAFRDLNPQAPVHMLVIPRKHIESLDAAEPADTSTLGHLLHVAAGVARDQGIAESGYRTVINTNRDGGQSVYHIHVHLLGGRALGWPPG